MCLLTRAVFDVQGVGVRGAPDVYHSTLGLRVIKKKKRVWRDLLAERGNVPPRARPGG